MSEQQTGGDRETYDVVAAQEKWRKVWEEMDPFRAADDGSRERRYALTMFPYPSGDLHMGHAEVMALHDVIARYWWQQGYDVMNPIGWDSFGLPAENAAIRNDEHPATYTYANIETQAESFRRYGVSFDWSRRLHTSDPEYYRWTQWLFLRFRERGLAYRKHSPVNWCPNDQTVLANEQVVQGMCERCGAEVTKRELSQWYFKVTDYADRLLDDMAALEGKWPDRVLAMQRNWIGRSEGAHVDFEVEATDTQDATKVTVFTTRPDTLYGATFFVVAADAWLADQICAPEQREQFDTYLESVRRETDIARLATDKEKTGVFLGRYAVNPVNGERIPVWAADYVLADYGTGAVMAVPAHDQRDLDFAREFGLPVRMVVDTGEPDPAETFAATPGDGTYVNSGELDGLTDKVTGIRSIVARLEEQGTGRGAVNFRLRDWLLSRQRFWGPPIPIVHCDECGEVAVPDDQLPVELPDLRGADLKPKGVSPLAAAEDWVNVPCPDCGRPAKRDTDTMDTFVDSSWYFLRYCSPHYEDGPFDPEAVRRWMPAQQYVGGVEHAILHLLYSRFFTKVLHDMGMLDFVEPFTALMNQGQVINQGKAMSKSLGNGVNLGEMLDEYGVDAVRLTLVFAGPARGRHRLGRHVARRVAEVPAARVAAGWGRHRSGRGGPGDRGRLAAPGDAPDRQRRGRTGRQPSVQRDGGPGHGAGERHPQGDRLRLRPRRPGGPRGGRGRRDPAEPGRPVHRRGDVVASGPRADRRQGRLAHGGPRAAGPAVGHCGRPGPGQGPREAGGVSRHLRGRPGGRGDGGGDDRAPTGGQDRAQGHRAGAEPGQHRRRLSRPQRYAHRHGQDRRRHGLDRVSACRLHVRAGHRRGAPARDHRGRRL